MSSRQRWPRWWRGSISASPHGTATCTPTTRQRAALDEAADEIDADPADLRREGPLRALRVRALTEAVAADVLTRTGRALGAGPLGHDEAHSRAVADLTVYLRQHHAERDLARLGELVAEAGDTW